MAPSMLASQLATLQDPRGEEGVCWVDIAGSKGEVRRRSDREVRGLLGWVQREKEDEVVSRDGGRVVESGEKTGA